MTNFLKLCQNVATDSGTVSGTHPSSVIAQAGRLQKIVRRVAQAWTQIQNSRDSWRWMRAEFSGNTTAGTAKYTGASWSLARHARWITEAGGITIYKESEGVADEGALALISWADWRLKYGRGEQTQNRPIEYAISPANEMCFGPIPDDTYVVNGEYYKTPQELAANEDTPECPARFHEIIEHKAQLLLAEFDEAPFAMATAQKNYNDVLFDMERSQLPQITIGGGPLA